jgi:hypothetical protein
MLINQLTPHLPKDNKEVNAHVKRLQAMLDIATVVDPSLDHHDEARGHEFDHRHTWLVVSLHQRNVVEGETGMIETCTMSSTAKIHTTR